MKLHPLFIVIMLTLTACGHKTDQAGGHTDSQVVDTPAGIGVDKHSEAYIRQRIDSIYNSLVSW